MTAAAAVRTGSGVTAPSAPRKPHGLLDMAGPWPWLAYLPLYAFPWLWYRPTPEQLAGSAAGIALFLAFYVWGARQRGDRLLVAAIGVLLTSFALAFAGGQWTVISIYAAAMAAQVRPARRGAGVVILFVTLAGVVGWTLDQPSLWWAFGLFFMVMAGFGNLSHAALEDKNAALVAAGDEVRRLAATAERERIGRDLHDLLGRTLTLVAVKAELAAKLAGRDASAAEREMREVAEAARGALAEVRDAVAGMTGASLAREVDASRAALAAAGVECSVDGEPEAVAPGAGAVLAMALREAVTNVIRHSGARRCRIQVDASGPGDVRLIVVDDGRGDRLREGGGLGGMRGRLQAAGGALEVGGGASGTRLVASLPAAALA